MLTLIYDLETTGFPGLSLFSHYHRIVQISVYALELDKSYTTLIDPKMSIPPWSTKIHGIKDGDVLGAPTIEEAMKCIFQELDIDDKTEVEWIAHNNTFFDRIILSREFPIVKKYKWWDTLPFLREKYPGLPSYSLGNLYEHFYSSPLTGAHSAENDVQALVSMYRDYIVGCRGDYQFVYEPVILTDIRYVGKYRAKLIQRYLGMTTESVGELRKKMKDIHGVDRWLATKINIKDSTQRLFVLAAILCLPLDELKTDIMDPVEYYVSVRFGDNKNDSQNALYYRGLELCTN